MVNNKSSKNFVNLIEIINLENIFSKNKIKKLNSLVKIENAFECKSLLSKKEVSKILKEVNDKINKEVGVTGYVSDYKEGVDELGSYRCSIYNEKLANILFNRIKLSYPERDFILSNNSHNDDHNKWLLKSVNPLFRFIKYNKGGKLVPHYDFPYIKDNKERSLVTVIIYLTSNPESGSTRFILDPQLEKPIKNRNLSDWNHYPNEKEIILSINPIAGNAIIFDHGILHDGEELKGNQSKILIRTDLIFERVF